MMRSRDEPDVFGLWSSLQIILTYHYPVAWFGPFFFGPIQVSWRSYTDFQFEQLICNSSQLVYWSRTTHHIIYMSFQQRIYLYPDNTWSGDPVALARRHILLVTTLAR
jgi:hypothetical protein